MTLTQSCLVFAIIAGATAQAMPTTHFDQFFPYWNQMLQETLHENCSAEYAVYMTGEREPGSSLSSLISPVVNCMLETLPEYKKAELGASAVVLGLLPTILQTLGSTPAETALLSLRRPFLALLLALGSPSVATMKTSEFMTTVQDLVEHGDTRPTTISTFRWRQVTSRWRVVLSLAEYLVTMVAVANVVYLAYQLGFHAIVTFAPETVFLLPLWTFICIVIHLGGVLILYLKLHIDHKAFRGKRTQPPRASRTARDSQPYRGIEQPGHQRSGEPGTSTFELGTLHKRPTFLSQEVTPAAFQSPKRLRWRKETILVNCLIWLLSVGTLANLVFGTMVFSSLLFFSVKDVLLIIGRYFLSTLVCRAIVRVELSGMKECTYYEPGDAEDEDQAHLHSETMWNERVVSTEMIPLKDAGRS